MGSTILTGEVVSSSRFGFDNASIEVPDGLVAVSVPTREVQAVGGALEAGMSADVYSVGATTTSRIAQGAQVLATSAGADRSVSASDSWVTLAVQPAIVQELVTAVENAQIYFVLPSASVHEAEAALASASQKAAAEDTGNQAGASPEASQSTSGQEQSIHGNAHVEQHDTSSASSSASSANANGAQ